MKKRELQKSEKWVKKVLIFSCILTNPVTHRNASSSYPPDSSESDFFQIFFLFFAALQMNNKRFNNFKDFFFFYLIMHGKSKLQSFLMISKLKRTFLVRCHVNWIQINLIESFSKLLKALENLNSSGYLHTFIPKTFTPAANVDYASISYSRKRNKSRNFTCNLHKTTPTWILTDTDANRIIESTSW